MTREERSPFANYLRRERRKKGGTLARTKCCCRTECRALSSPPIVGLCGCREFAASASLTARVLQAEALPLLVPGVVWQSSVCVSGTPCRAHYRVAGCNCSSCKLLILVIGFLFLALNSSLCISLSLHLSLLGPRPPWSRLFLHARA